MFQRLQHSNAAVACGTSTKTNHKLSATSAQRLNHQLSHSIARGYKRIYVLRLYHAQAHGFCHFYYRLATFYPKGRITPSHQGVVNMATDYLVGL